MVKKVKCINDDGLKNRLTYGKHYKVYKEDFINGHLYYQIRDNSDVSIFCLQGRFKEIKEEEMFTKDDLLDGDKLTDREGDFWYVCGEYLSCLEWGSVIELCEWGEDLKDNCDDYSVTQLQRRYDIMKVERRGEVIWEREESSSEISKEKEELQKVISKLQADLDDTKAKLDNL